ncbi:MAG TPA: hypothetical protein VJ983_09715 [candidate division Zixibacteria bacterium]|nr:hypothetical protein [candidate division Zixibacteria bacterium]
MNKPFKTSLIFLAIALLAVGSLIQTGCNGSSDIVNPPLNDKYRIQGALVKDANLDAMLIDSTRIALTLTRQDTTLTTALIRFDGDTLTYNKLSFLLDSVYSFKDSIKGLVPSDLYDLVVRDSNLFQDTAKVYVPDTFSITSVIPGTRISNGGDQIRLVWTSAAGIQGYAVGVVMRGSQYQGTGYSQYITTLTTDATIPPDAFRLTDPNSPDTGWYYLYVYGYTGSPDSAISSELLPVPFPSQLPDNVARNDFHGQIGAVVVSKKDSMHVVLQ